MVNDSMVLSLLVFGTKIKDYGLLNGLFLIEVIAMKAVCKFQFPFQFSLLQGDGRNGELFKNFYKASFISR